MTAEKGQELQLRPRVPIDSSNLEEDVNLAEAYQYFAKALGMKVPTG